MQIRPEQISAHLKACAGAQGFKPIYTLHGDEPLQAQEAADALRAAAREAGYTERVVFVVSGAHFDWSAVMGAAQAMSLFAQRQLIEIRIPSGKPGKEGSAALQQYCAAQSAQAADVLTLVHLPRLDRQQLQGAWFTALDEAGVTMRVDPVERRELPAWIARRMAVHGQRVAEGEEGVRTLAFFADRVEGHLLAAHQEIEKLALLHPPGELSFEQVERAVLNVARYDVFKLGEALWAGQTARALRMLEGLRAEGEAPVLVHWTMAEDIRTLWRLRQAMDEGKPLPMALREQRVWGAKERLFERLLQRAGAAPLAALVQAASHCDGVIKGLRDPGWPADAWQALRELALGVLALARAEAPLRRA